MKNTRLGCFTLSGLMSAVLTALLITGFTLVSGGMVFSPGALNAQTGAQLGGVSSHADIAGHCNLCHAPFWGIATMADRCVVCHTDVAVQRLTSSPLHGVLPNLTCFNCHPDHRGQNAPLTAMDAAQFPHNSVGYSLTAHQHKSDSSSFSCKDCHTQNYVPPFDQNICTNCHTQIDEVFVQTHSLDFGSVCLACHDGVDSYGRNFNHNGVPYQLIGKHAQVACGQCHVNARSIVDLKSTPQDCASCHARDDKHTGRFGTNCGGCHTSNGWLPASFDHNLSTFKLTGQHVHVLCGNCHINNVYQGTPTDCYSCHQKDDKHKNQFGTNCAACHTTVGWLPVNVDHNLFAFKLTGKHTTVTCENCHINNNFQGTPTDCYSCHQKNDTHNGRFGKNCSACHSTSGWLPATFDHNLSGFPLTGAHVSLNCTQCHTGGVYSRLSTACAACHAEPAIHAGVFGTNCAQCHNSSNWNATFSHPGGCDGNCINHAGASCTDCHKVNYSTATCTKCHDSNTPGGGD